MPCHTLSLLSPFEASNSSRYLFLTVKDPDKVLCVYIFAGISSTHALVPPQIILIEAVGAIANLWLNLCLHSHFLSVGTGSFFHC